MGVVIGNPPANGLPLGAEWQATQSPSLARYAPRCTSASSAACADVCIANGDAKLSAKPSAVPETFNVLIMVSLRLDVLQLAATRQLPQPFAGGGIDRVCQGRRQRRRARLADPARRFGA